MDNKEIWKNILNKINEDINSFTFNTWFRDTQLYKIEDGVAKIIVPYPFHKKHLEDNYKDYIQSLFIKEIGEHLELEFLIEEDIVEEIPTIIEKEEKKEEDLIPFESNLNKNYTFDTFVVGNSNKFAHAAALQVAQKPGETYNPLFIYGNSGLGKTHLMHAIGNYIVNNSKKKVLYVTSDSFQNEYTRIASKQDNYEYMDFLFSVWKQHLVLEMNFSIHLITYMEIINKL